MSKMVGEHRIENPKLANFFEEVVEFTEASLQ
jgi:hypothetical protein